MIQSTSTQRVRFAETDAMGVVYHGNYFPWFEAGRIQLLDDLGLPYREMEALGVRLPVLEGHAEYVRPARFDDRVRIVTTIREKPGARIRIEYEVFLDDTLLTRGYTVHAFMNNEGRAIKPPAEMLIRLRGGVVS